MFYYIARFIVGIYYCFFYRIKIMGSENIPKKGGFILCSNHISVKDPMVLGIVIKRKLSFIAKKELFKNKLFSLVLYGLNCIPVDRGNVDMSTFKTVIAKLKAGNAIGIFAQGKRVRDNESRDAKSGVALFAIKANVPIIPVCISSNYKNFSKIYINIGEPITLEEYRGVKIKTDGLNEITEYVMEKINELRMKDF